MGLFNFLFSWMCKRVFNQVDHNKNGKIEPLEVEVAILQMYNMVNKRLPGWQDPPSRADIMTALEVYDKDKNGVLDVKEFEEFAKSLMRNGPDMFFARVGKNAVVHTAMLPAASVVVQKAISTAGAGNVPLVMLAPILGSVIGAIRGLIPV